MPNLVTLPIAYSPDPEVGKPIGLGQVYIGVVDLDPAIEANRIDLILIQEDGTQVALPAASQPLSTGAGGVIIYNGSPVAVYTMADEYSMKVTTSNDAQKYYFENVSKLSNKTTYLRFTDGASGLGLSGTNTYAEEGDVIQTTHFDSDQTAGSGASFQATGVTTAGKAGNCPDADGYFYDAAGRQFRQVNTYPVASFGSSAPAVAAASVDGGEVIFPIGTTTEDSTIVPNSSDSATRLLVRGINKFRSLVRTSLDGVLMYARQGIQYRDLDIGQTGTVGTGRGISTNNSQQITRASFLNKIIRNFRIGIWARYSLWTEFRNIELRDNTCGIKLARNSYDAGNANAAAPGGWNLDPGWFHNQNTFDNIYVEGGEVGLWVTGMGNTYMNVTTQGQDTDGSANDMLPGTQQGTGLYLDSRGDGTRAFQNVVINHYVENSKIGAYYQDQQHVLVDGMFMQGGTSGDRAEALVVADRAEVTLNAVTGQDFFDAKVKAINGSLVWVNSMKGPINATTEWDADATSKIKMRGIVDKDKFEYFMDKPNGTASMDFVLPTEVPQFSVAKLYLTGIRDGTSSRFGEMTIARYTTAAGIRAAWITGGNDTWPTQIDVSVSNAGVITVTLMDTPRIQMYAILELIGGHMLSGNATTITGT